MKLLLLSILITFGGGIGYVTYKNGVTKEKLIRCSITCKKQGFSRFRYYIDDFMGVCKCFP